MPVKILVNLFRRDTVKKYLIFFCTFILIFMILISTLITKKYNFSEGEIAKVTIKAPRDIKDEHTTELLIEQETKKVQPQYMKSTEVKVAAIDDINNFFVKAIQIKDSNNTDKDKLAKLKTASSIPLSDDKYTAIMKLTRDELKSLQDFLNILISDLYDNNNIEKDKPEDIKKAQESILLKINSENQIPQNIKSNAVSISFLEIKPNYFYDSDKTNELKDEAKRKVSPYIIKKDQTIVEEGKPVGENEIELLKSAGLYGKGSKFNWYIYLSLGALVLLVMSLQWYYIYKYNNEIFKSSSKMLLICILNIIALILARSLSIISPFLIPLACIPMVFTLLINHRVSLTISLLNCIFISAVVNFNIEITLLAIMNAVVGSLILEKMQQRSDIIYSTLYISAISTALTVTVGFLLSNNAIDVLTNTIYAFSASILSGVLTIGFSPFFENTFDIVTNIKLLELSNPNQPLLKRLLIEAPGTYHHSVLVGNLAEMAAEVVGANPVLTRVSAYYHDVGKLKRPYFFKENQMGNDNPHDKITPNLSTLIITSHVKDGLELAKEYRIPKIIRDVIEQHHGTSLVKYFYVTMKNSSERPEDINEEDFKYPGPIPETKEAGIIMLADSVEASVRSISDPTRGKIEEMVNNIIKSRLNDGQLDNCDLTLKDLDKIRGAFLKVLNGIYHQRIEYPVDKWELKNKGEKA